MAPSYQHPSKARVELLVDVLDWGEDSAIYARFSFDRFHSDVGYGAGILLDLTNQFDKMMLAARPFKPSDVDKYNYFCWFQDELFTHWQGFHHANEATHGWCVCTNHYKPKVVVDGGEEGEIVNGMAHVSIN